MGYGIVGCVAEPEVGIAAGRKFPSFYDVLISPLMNLESREIEVPINLEGVIDDRRISTIC